MGVGVTVGVGRTNLAVIRCDRHRSATECVRGRSIGQGPSRPTACNIDTAEETWIGVVGDNGGSLLDIDRHNPVIPQFGLESGVSYSDTDTSLCCDVSVSYVLFHIN